jgi:MFS family permease
MGGITSLPALLAARTVYGLGMGLAMHAAPAYIAETAPPSARGLLISLKEVMIVGGILLGYLSSYWFVDAVGGWRSIYGIAAPLALLLGIGMVSGVTLTGHGFAPLQMSCSIYRDHSFRTPCTNTIFGLNSLLWVC